MGPRAQDAVDRMSYEDLLQLEEQIGIVTRGATAEQIETSPSLIGDCTNDEALGPQWLVRIPRDPKSLRRDRGSFRVPFGGPVRRSGDFRTQGGCTSLDPTVCDCCLFPLIMPRIRG